MKTRLHLKPNSSDTGDWRGPATNLKADKLLHDVLAMAVGMTKTEPENVMEWNATHLKCQETPCFWCVVIEIFGFLADKSVVMLFTYIYPNANSTCQVSLIETLNPLKNHSTGLPQNSQSLIILEGNQNKESK